MDLQKLEYTDLTSFLLNVVRRRPAMLLRESKISHLDLFILGYRIGNTIGKNLEDNYFGDDGFMEWYCKKYNIKQPSYTMMPFIDKANGDEVKALEIYFKYLEDYQKEREILR